MSRARLASRLLWVVDRESIDNGSVARALAAGVGWLHLRDDSIRPRTWQDLLPVGAGVRIVVNGGPPWALEHGWGAHLKAAQPRLSAAQRDAWGLLGRSVHDPPETLAALGDRPDYLVAGPVFPTPSKPGHPGIGLDGLARIVAAAGDCPVLAIGGIRAAHVEPVRKRGACGVALRSGITAAADPAAAVEAYARALPVDADEPDLRGAGGLGPGGPDR